MAPTFSHRPSRGPSAQAVFAQWGSSAPVSRRVQSSNLPWVFVAGVLASILLGMLGYWLLWSGAGGVAGVPNPAESLYLAEVARTQADVKLVTMDMLVMESTLPEIDPGQVAGIADGGDLLRGNLTDWEGRKAPSADMERSHGAMVAALGEMAGAVQRAVTGLESGDPGAAFSAAEAYKSAEADFSSACAALFGED